MIIPDWVIVNKEEESGSIRQFFRVNGKIGGEWGMAVASGSDFSLLPLAVILVMVKRRSIKIFLGYMVKRRSIKNFLGYIVNYFCDTASQKCSPKSGNHFLYLDL